MEVGAELSLRERVPELAAVDHGLQKLAAGQPGLLVIEGPAGIGKTSLLMAMRERALKAGMRVLTARGSELERDFSFGVVGQLLEPVIYAGDDVQRARWFAGAAELARPLFSSQSATEAGQEEELAFRRQQGLFWLIANLARDGALVAVVDDAHWADEPSAAFLRFLATRLEQLSVLLVVASRPDRGVWSGLALEPGAQVLRPTQLSSQAVSDWISEALGQPADDAFVVACHRATGGNPFLVSELLRELRSEGLVPGGEAIERLRSVSPRGVATSVLLRLGGLAPACGAVARAAAIVGESELRVTAALAGVDPDTAMRAASELTRAGVFDTGQRPGFVHPLVRTVIYEDLPSAERLMQHARAAHILQQHGARAEQVAAQLVLSAPIGERWASDALATAAGAAAARGAPEVAARFLDRLLAEGGDEQRFEVLLALGRVQALAGHPGALANLRAAAAGAHTPAQHVRAAVSLGRVLRYSGAGEEAVTLLDAAASRIGAGDRELSDLIRRELLATSTVSYGARRRLAARTAAWWQAAEHPPRSFFDRFLAASHAVEAISAGQPVSDALRFAGQAVAQDLGSGHLGRHVRLLAAYAFLLCDRFDRVDGLLHDLAQIATDRGGAEMLATVAAQRSLVAQRRGRVLAAEAEALDALQAVAEQQSPPSFLLTASATLTWVADERGQPPHPLAVRSRDDGDSLFGRHLNYARALAHLRERRLQQGIDELLAVGERELGIGWNGPSQFAWRSEAGLALVTSGQADEGRRLIDEELAHARECGAPRALGIALRARALISPHHPIELLREAVAVLDGSGAELEHARALVDLGATLRRSRRPADARASLQRGYELASGCGASLLATRAHEELLAAGARPRRSALTGRDALTPSELRVAELAAQSLRNRDIAQALFVTEKTVERHLGHAYSKLGVSSRRELAGALTDR